MEVKVYPSLLSVNVLNVEYSIRLVEKIADGLHVDIMDGHFVPNLSYGPSFVEAIKKRTDLSLNVHLMVKEPEKFVDLFIDAGVDELGFHIETTYHPQRLIKYIRDHGVRPFVTLNPVTPLNSIEYLLGDVDMVLLMTVNPGYGGQEFLRFCLKKVRRLREMAVREGISLDIMVDGGIDLSTAPLVVDMGANILISGYGIFGSNDPADTILKMKSLKFKEV
ncbi:MAG TPA: ribulose-phosphate 3-epimerase [Dictyoglomaceae bacterium]|nr:ribulose-phosphate 3-epimerase [Dictyoglomaceae bacterium]HOL39082.1 ribulose-phosphate 3-epimerase [Dictyoglomaceae bacterium]HOP94308.1 ribulose-phosphate 3-epimerase [Dictyoglomaceae bacterium]HPP15236.1 ribulose-phosphate 3-epimerase [Dictyoglomaceae bacterium]HPU42643.1 ribulose-phosphate 3-epimerase [Dictyoglomaceae bacterium]